jgi:Zn-dependent M28 family amino/carboxypeptidase
MRLTLALIALFSVVACSQRAPKFDSINAESLMSEIRTLSSDDFEGRKPGSAGEQKTIAFLQGEFQKMGLKPGNPDGTYLQKVPLAGIRSRSVADISVKGRKLPLENGRDYIALSLHYDPVVTVSNSDVVFVGYGVVAPEYGWDDYKDVDVRGKTILMLINDPQIPDKSDPSKLDDKVFRGRAMTYYGRWTYKYEIAAQKGAAAAIIVHETGPAGYPFEVVSGSWGGENFTIARPDRNAGLVPVQSWMVYDKVAELCRMSGLDLASLKKNALDRNFRPVTLPGAKASFNIENTLRTIDSHNVVAKLEGSDPEHRDEYVVYTAHWDHLGKDPALSGDQIYNGAEDNASGTSGLLEIARAYSKLPKPPKRSILFLSVTAEEQGLLGSEYYAENPLYPLNKTLADINMDGLNTWGMTKDIEVVGLGNSTLDDDLNAVLKPEGRTVTGDAEPEKGHFYRSDHFEFAKQGVPAIDPGAGDDYIGKPQGYGKRKRDEYTERDYHKPSDEIKPDWDLSGAVQDLKALAEVGYRIANGERFPEWKPGTEFKAKRDAQMAGTSGH